MRTVIALATIAIFLAVNCSLAGVMSGTVKDEDGKPMPNLDVSVWGKDIKGKTDANGKFRISSDKLIVGNRYAIKVNAEGYDSAQTFSTEIFEDESDQEPLELTVYKEQALDVSIPTNFPPGMMGYMYGATNRMPVSVTNQVSSDGSMEIDIIDAEPAEPAKETKPAKDTKPAETKPVGTTTK